MKTCVCDVCGQSLPMHNQLDATILGVALDLCPDCQAWANDISREDMVMIMLEGFRVRRKSNGVRGMDGGAILLCGGPSPEQLPREGEGGNGRPPDAGTGGDPSYE